MAQNLEGQVLSERYRFEALVGEGTFARVYRVHDLRRNVDLAAKVLREDIAHEPSFVERFRREGEVLSQLQHPHIVRYYGIVETPQATFMLLDFIDGSTLQSYLHALQTPMSPRDVLKFLRPICAALTYAHGENIIHRDVKPGNILISTNNQVYITDFGIARLLKEASSLTQGVTVGTPLYMAPEQIMAQEVTAATDIYAVGVLLYQMLTGKLPFTGTFQDAKGSTASERVAYEHVHLQPMLLRQVNPAIPPEVESVVMRCLRKTPSERFPSALAVYDALAAAVGAAPLPTESVTVEQPPLPPDVTLPEWSRLSPQPIVPPPSASQAVPPGVQPPKVATQPMAVPPSLSQPGVTVQSHQPPPQQPPAQPTVFRSEAAPPARGTVPNLRVSPPPPPTQGNMPPQQELYRTGSSYQTKPVDKNRRYIIGAAVAGSLLVLAVICLVGAALLASVSGDDENDNPTRRPVGANALTATNIAAANNPNRPTPLGFPGSTTALQEIIYSGWNQGDFDIYRLDFTRGTPSQITTGPLNEVGPRFSPDGTQIVYYAYNGATGNGDIFVMAASGSGQRNLTNSNNADDRMPVWSPDGRQIAYHTNTDGDYDIYIYTLADGSTRQLTSTSANDQAPAWSPDGTRIAFQSDEGNEIFIVNVDGSGRKQVSNGQWQASAPAWSPDGTRLIFTATSSNTPDIYAINPDGGGLQDLFAGNWRPRKGDWSVDGRRLLYIGGTDDDPGIFVSDFTNGQTIGYVVDGIDPDWRPR